MTSQPRTADTRLVSAGVLIAAGIPAILIATAVLWSSHLISLDRNEAVVSALESAGSGHCLSDRSASS
jgi:hypothetical protein